MTYRVVLTGGLLLFGIGLYVLGRRAHLWLVRRRMEHSAGIKTPGLATFQPGQPALLYFTSPSCVPCRTIIKPALRRLIAELGSRFQVLEIDAASQTEVARYWNVMSVPTIFVLDPQGKPRYVHYGVVKKEVLRAQLGDWLAPV